MRLFGNKKEGKPVRVDEQSSKLLQRLKMLQRRFADKLEYRFGLLSVRSQKTLLVLLLSTLIMASVAIAVQSILDNKGTIKIKHLPRLINDSAGKSTTPDSIITKAEYDRVELLKSRLFLMQNDAKNKKVFDSIMLQNPHLLDSIAAFEKMYLSQ